MVSEVFFVNMWTRGGVSKMAKKRRGGGTPRPKAKSFFGTYPLRVDAEQKHETEKQENWKTEKLKNWKKEKLKNRKT